MIITYTAEFVAEQGAANVAAYIAQLEQETNLSFQLSGVNMRVDIVHSYQTIYSDPPRHFINKGFNRSSEVYDPPCVICPKNKYHH